MTSRARVGLFVTCLVDLFRPVVGFAALELLERAGFAVQVPRAQTCCGQVAYNAGDRPTARAIAHDVIDAFAALDHVVVPSGSCAAMIARHYPDLVAPARRDEALALAARTRELATFLDAAGAPLDPAPLQVRAVYHDACSGLRELGIRAAPRRLLARVPGLTLLDCADAEVCCGFGGTFCVRYSDISVRMVADKAAVVRQSGASLVLGGDLGCLLNIAGRLAHESAPVAVRHMAEALAGMTSEPAIGAR